jgi:hypothetical protein
LLCSFVVVVVAVVPVVVVVVVVVVLAVSDAPSKNEGTYRALCTCSTVVHSQFTRAKSTYRT